MVARSVEIITTSHGRILVIDTATFPAPAASERLVGSGIDSSTALLAKQSHDIVRFAMGAPGEDLIPVAQLDEAFAASAKGRYDYGESEGEPALREQILRISEASGLQSSNERLPVTTGGMQGLDLAFKIFVNPGDLVFEPFCGSGTQLIAAERTGRRCHAVELDPVYCDVAVRRWELATGRKASRD